MRTEVLDLEGGELFVYNDRVYQKIRTVLRKNTSTVSHCEARQIAFKAGGDWIPSVGEDEKFGYNTSVTPVKMNFTP